MVEQAQPFQHRSLTRSVRPRRAVTLVCAEGDWRPSILRTLEGYSRTWGGDANGLIACSPAGAIGEANWPLLRSFDADQIVAYVPTLLGLRMSDPAAYEAEVSAMATDSAQRQGVEPDKARAWVETDEFLSSGTGPIATADDTRVRTWLAPAIDERIVIRGAYKADNPPPHGLVDMCRLDAPPARIAEIDTSALPMAVQLLVAARIGRVGPKHRAHLQDQGVTEWLTVTATPEDTKQLLEYAWSGDVDSLPARLAHRFDSSLPDFEPPQFVGDEFAASTPFAHARLGCNWLQRADRSLNTEPLVIVCGDTAEDFCFAYTRDRVARGTYWLPLDPDNDNDLTKLMYDTLAHVLSSRHSHYLGDRPVLLTSLSCPPERLEAARTALLDTVWARSPGKPGEQEISISVREVSQVHVERSWYLLDKVHFATEGYEPFVGDDMVANLEVLVPSEVRSADSAACTWQVDATRFDHVLPARWALRGTLTVPGNGLFMPSAVRSSANGISVESHGRAFQFSGSPLSQMLIRTRLRFPGPTEIFSTLAAGTEMTLRDSDKGRYTQRIVELWGDLTSLAADLASDAPTRTLLKDWTSKDQGHGRIHDERKYLRASDMARITKLNKPQVRELIDRLLGRSIAFRGLVLRCRLCANTSFYRLEDIGPGYRCPRCRQSNEITSGAWTTEAAEPEWFYSLDEVVYLGLTNNMHVPVLALGQLAKKSSSFLHMPEAVVQKDGESDIEIDMWAIIDGRIVLGEAKKNNRLAEQPEDEETRCARLLHLIRAWGVDEFVMATASSRWAERTVKTVETALADTVQITWMANLR